MEVDRLAAEVDRLSAQVERYEAAAKNPGDDQRHRGATVAMQLLYAQWMREKADAERDTLRADRDALKAGAATVTWGDADAVIAALVAERDMLFCELGDVKELHKEAREDAVSWRMECVKAERERDAAQQDAQTLHTALSDILWEVKDSSAAKKVALDALATTHARLADSTTSQ
jgi:hypothetical protein